MFSLNTSVIPPQSPKRRINYEKQVYSESCCTAVQQKALNRARIAHRLLSMTAIIACLAVVPAFADNEALNAVKQAQ